MDTIILIGAEDVSRAGSSMHSAAESIRNSVSGLYDIQSMQQRMLDDFLVELERVLKEGLQERKKE